MTTLGVVINNFQYGRFVGAAVESVLAQAPGFDRVVVVDDGSTDDSLEVLAAYGDRIEVVSQANSGQLGACLVGAEACATDYVYFLDADDVALPGLVAGVLGVVGAGSPGSGSPGSGSPGSGSPSGGPVKVQFRLRGVAADLSPLGSVFPTFPAGYDAPAMVADNARTGFYVCPPTSGNVFLRSALLGLDWDGVDRRQAVDGVPALVMPYLGDIVCLDETLACYRIHDGNLSLAEGSVAGAGFEGVLARELAEFESRWVTAAGLLGLSGPPYGDRVPDFVVERRLMLAALGVGEAAGAGGGGSVWRWGLLHLGRVAAGGAPAPQRLALVAWTLLLLLPVPPLRRRLVRLQRSAVGRPAWVRAAVRLMQRRRRSG